MKLDLSLSRQLVKPVLEYADRVIESAADRFGEPTPLLATYLDPGTLRPARLPDGAGGELVLCNLANQLNVLRMFHGLSVLSGESSHRDRALAMIRYMLRHGRRRGMLLWGNHAGLDLLTKKPVFLSIKGKVHELKAHYPPYDLMWEADPVALASAIAYHWHGHMYDWSRLDFSRHGRMDLPDYPLPADPWSAAYAGGPVFFIGGGLTFVNAGSDLYLAGAELARLSGAPGPLLWAERLMTRYAQTRDPRTGMSGYVYSSIYDKHDPEKTRSADRAWVQFKDQFGAHRPLEGTLTNAGCMGMIAGASALCRLHVARTAGSAGEPFGQSAVEDVEAYARHAYDFGDNTFHPLFTDGFRLTGLAMARDGYYGPAGRMFEARPAGWRLFWSHLAAWRYSASPLLWAVARNIGLHKGLGDIGAIPGAGPELHLAAGAVSPDACFALLELDRALPGAGYLEAAARLAGMLIREHVREGWFTAGDSPVLDINRPEPLAILHVAARLAGRDGVMLPYFSSSALTPLTGWVREDSDARNPT